VDDEERFLSTTKKLLSRKGYEVFTAMSGAEALVFGGQASASSRVWQGMAHVALIFGSDREVH